MLRAVSESTSDDSLQVRAIFGADRRTAILSNGEPGMLADAVRSSGLDGLLDHVLSVETIGVFKPDPRVYRLAVRALSRHGSTPCRA